MMMGSWEALTSYQTALGVAHQFRSSDHYGPMPNEWFQRDDWSPVYYNQADSAGLGFDRSPTGSNLVAQYFSPIQERYGNIDTTPENLLMWFHHVPWDRRMSSGRAFWDELVYRYQMGVQYVTWLRETWDTLEPFVGARRFAEVKAKLALHETDAASWRDASVNYWREFSGREIPVDGGPLSAKITVGGKEVGGFNLSSASYTIPVAAGASPEITNVRLADPARARRSSRRRRRVPGQAVVKVTKTDFFGPLVKNYVFNLVPDTTLRSLRVNGTQLASFKPEVLTYNAVMNPGADAVATVKADASDPAATVSVEQAASPTGQARSPSPTAPRRRSTRSTWITAIRGSDEFDGPRSARSGRWCGPTTPAGAWPAARSSSRSQNGDLQGNTNTATQRRAPGRQRRLDGGLEARLLAPARQQQRAGRDHRLRQRPELREAGVGDEQRHAADQQAARRGHPRAERRGDRRCRSRAPTRSASSAPTARSGCGWPRPATPTGRTTPSDGSVYRFMGSTTLNVEPTQGRPRRLQPRRHLDRPRRRLRPLPDREPGRPRPEPGRRGGRLRRWQACRRRCR